jgi:hypothetical protein
MSAVADLTTSRRLMNSAGMSRNSTAGLVAAPLAAAAKVESIDWPLTSTRTRPGSTPRIETEEPSPPARPICTPVTRCNASPTFLSGNLPTSSAEMASST